MDSHDSEEREYSDVADQIREVLIHGNYMSQKDIEICRSFDLTTLVDKPHYDHMRELHDALVATYAADDASEAA